MEEIKNISEFKINIDASPTEKWEDADHVWLETDRGLKKFFVEDNGIGIDWLNVRSINGGPILDARHRENLIRKRPQAEEERQAA